MTLTRNADEQIAIVEIKGKPNILEIQQQLVDAVNFIKDESLEYALLDTCQMEVMFTLSLYWYRMKWLPLAKESGLKCLAVVLPRTFINEKQLQRLHDSAEKLKLFKLGFFLEVDQARDWIANSE